MSLEIERKFLPASDEWRSQVSETHQIKQGYIARSEGNTVRIRVSETTSGTVAILCIKGKSTSEGVPEFEFAIDAEMGKSLLDLCGSNVITKIRHHIEHDGLIYEVDEFTGQLAGNVLIEVELEKMSQPLSLPAWVGLEVTNDLRYTNASLARDGWPS